MKEKKREKVGARALNARALQLYNFHFNFIFKDFSERKKIVEREGERGREGSHFQFQLRTNPN